MILDTTTTWDYDEIVDKCLQHGGILPEPKSREENEFLSGLGYDTLYIFLGMNARETDGTWVWNSDSTPVVYQNWYPNYDNRDMAINCALMTVDDYYWYNTPCNHQPGLWGVDIKLICQKAEGWYFSLF